ncbi:MAG: phosphatidate cytidylyltransferase [Polyangia bacterium]|jgi:phosphatidate cytidylyltransferase
MSNLVLRFLTAVVAVPLLILAISWKEPYGVWAWILIAQVTGLREWMNMTLPAESAATRWLGVLCGVLLGNLFCWVPDGHIQQFGLFAVTSIGLLYFLFVHGNIETVASRMSMWMLGILYAGVLIVPLVMFKTTPKLGGGFIYVCLTSAWVSDTGAYFAGRFLGPMIPAKLWPAVSPKKTWIGSVGGLLGSVLALCVAKLWYLPMLSWLDVFAIAIPANILGQLGDLVESLIKRSVGVKDSGVLLPGHGGMLDRIDALLLVVPYVYAYAYLRF